MIVGPQADADVLVVEGHGRSLGFLLPLCRRSRLFNDLGDDAGADGAAALADGEAQALVHGDGGDELHLHR